MHARISICLLILFAVSPVEAQKVTWEKTGDTELIFSSENAALFAHPNGDLFVGKIDWRGCGDYCGTDGTIYRSLDGGQTWEQTAYEGDGVASFAAWPNGDIMAASLEAVYRSTDRGSTWVETGSPESWSQFRSAVITADTVIYLGLGGAGMFIGGGLIRSTDGGQTWEEQDLGMDPFFPAQIREILELEDGTVLAAGSQGVYRLEPGGTWIHTGPDSTRYRSLAAVEGLVFAGSTDTVYRSSDAGLSWDPMAIPPSAISDIAVNHHGDVFVSASGGLYGSSTNGDDWERLGDAIGVLAVASDDHLVSASHLEGGLYRSATAVLSANEQTDAMIPHRVELHQNYPNPFAQETAIEFTLPHPASVLLEVFDVTGRRIATLADKSFSAGLHTVRFGGGSLPAGVYPYRLQVGSVMETRLLTVR
ncbi:MAG: T9SS type A sorting domain-containing protein [Rhodothermales bacterium]